MWRPNFWNEIALKEQREDIEKDIFFFCFVKFVDKKSKILYNKPSEKMYILNMSEGGKEMKKVLKIDGMGCEHCVKAVTGALSSLEGVSLVEVKIGEATVEVADHYDMKKIQEALDDAGYDLL